MSVLWSFEHKPFAGKGVTSQGKGERALLWQFSCFYADKLSRLPSLASILRALFRESFNEKEKTMTTDKKEALREEEQEQQSVESAAQEETLPTEDAPSKEGGSKKDKVSKLKKKNEELQQEVEELKDKYLRLFAEFDNYKKRMLREKMELLETASKDTIKALLPVLDDFDRAKAAAGEENSKEPFSEGVELVYQKLHTILQQLGLEPMESTGKDFDPDHHEAIAEVPAPSEELKGKVVDTVEKGYKLKDQIIRHAKVVVGK